MFDMAAVSLRIAALRKQAGITQMELADRLGISYQAVSSWERGETMPDIGKLPSLSEELDVSIDELLGKAPSDRIAEGTAPVTTSYEEPAKEEKPSPAAAEERDIDENELAAVAPYVNTAFLETAAEKLYRRSGSLQKIQRLAPFLSAEFLQKIAEECLEESSGNSSAICGLAPFLDTAVLDNLAERQYQLTANLADIRCLAPFLSDEALIRLAELSLQAAPSLSPLSPLLPFLSTEWLNCRTKEILEQEGISGISIALPSIDSSVVEEYLRRYGS